MQQRISIIIPTFRERDTISRTLEAIRANGNGEQIEEVIVVDGGSGDGTLEAAASGGARAVLSPSKGRSAQMNYGAALARSPLLYFLHADTLPPPGFTQSILTAVQKGYGSGCFTLRFDDPHWFLQANSWFTRFSFTPFRFGDQSLFTGAALFREAGGFREDHIVLEDQEIITRLKKKATFVVLQPPVLTSSRKYRMNGIYKTQLVYFYIYLLYRLGFPQQHLVQTYRKWIRQDKI